MSVTSYTFSVSNARVSHGGNNAGNIVTITFQETSSLGLI